MDLFSQQLMDVLHTTNVPRSTDAGRKDVSEMKERCLRSFVTTLEGTVRMEMEDMESMSPESEVRKWEDIRLEGGVEGKQEDLVEKRDLVLKLEDKLLLEEDEDDKSSGLGGESSGGSLRKASSFLESTLSESAKLMKFSDLSMSSTNSLSCEKGNTTGMLERSLSVRQLDSFSDGSPRRASSLSARSSPQAPSKVAELSPIPEPKQFKRWKNATPSKFCHFCGRLPKAERVTCKNITMGTCRKVFCRPCMEKTFGIWDEEKSNNHTWECTHCAGACPTKASCRYYSKTNSRRFLKNT